MLITNNIYPQYNKAITRQPAFTGYKSAFSRKLDEVLLSGKQPQYKDEKILVQKLQKFINEKLKPDRKLGQGFRGSVYKIDDKYVLKTTRKSKPLADMVDEFTPHRFAGLKTYYGEPVASFYDVQILRNVSSKGKHIQAGIPYTYSMKFLPDECTKYYEETYLPVFAKLPQKSFDAIAKDCDLLNKMGKKDHSYSFDYNNPNNFVLVGKTLRITDVISEKTSENPNTMAQLLYSFLQKTDLDGNAVYNARAGFNRQMLLKKIVMAGMKYNLPIENAESDKKIWQVVANDLCKLKKPFSEIIEQLENLQKIPEAKLRLEKTSEYLNSLQNP